MQVNTITGFVKREIFAKGSKSEHLAVMIDTGVHKYFLRKAGGNPFMDPDILSLVDHYVEVEGRIVNNLFYVSKWKFLNGPE